VNEISTSDDFSQISEQQQIQLSLGSISDNFVLTFENSVGIIEIPEAGFSRETSIRSIVIPATADLDFDGDIRIRF
jgi:hypothetical protein